MYEEPFCDAEPFRNFRACFNCEYKDDENNCPIAREASEKRTVILPQNHPFAGKIMDVGPEIRFKGMLDIGTGEQIYMDDSKEECTEDKKKEEIIEAYRHPNCSWKKYTAAMARSDLVDHSCLRHRYAAEPGDKPICKIAKECYRPYASCEACDKEYGLEGPPCSDG